jgi:ubiquinone/menaquinone biosynthesis C-methylase UbiE
METEIRQQKERAIWDKHAASYDNQTLKIYNEAYDRSIQKIRSILSPEQQILEIGCGTGIISFGIAPYVKEVIATDLSPQMISAAQGKAQSMGISNIDFRVCDGYSLPYEDQTFDVVLIFNTLHIVKEPETLLQQTYRLLKPAGYFVSATDCYAESVPFPHNLKIQAIKLMKCFGFLPFIRFYTEVDLQNLLSKSSFNVIESITLHPEPVN